MTSSQILLVQRAYARAVAVLIKCTLVVGALFLSACGHGPIPEELVVDTGFSLEEQARIVEARDVWAGLCGEARVPPVRIGSDANIVRNCDGWPGQIFFADQHIEICPEAKTEIGLIAMHEIAHLIRQDEYHSEEPDSILQIRGFLPAAPSPADIDAVCGRAAP